LEGVLDAVEGGAAALFFAGLGGRGAAFTAAEVFAFRACAAAGGKAAGISACGAGAFLHAPRNSRLRRAVLFMC
jgi:hypothetical protein